MGWKGPLQPPYLSWTTSTLDKAVQGHNQRSFECLWGCRWHSLSGKSAPVLDHPHGKICSLAQLVSFVSCPFSVIPPGSIWLFRKTCYWTAENLLLYTECLPWHLLSYPQPASWPFARLAAVCPCPDGIREPKPGNATANMVSEVLKRGA